MGIFARDGLLLGCVLFAVVSPAAPILLRHAPFDPAHSTNVPLRVTTFAAAKVEIPARGLYLIQHEGVITPEWRNQLKSAGALIRRYIPENAYLVEITAESYAAVSAIEHSYLGAFKGEYKIDLPMPVAQTMAKDSTEGTDKAASQIFDCVVSLFEREMRETVVKRLEALDGADVISSGGKVIRVKLTTEGMRIVSEWVEVESIELYVEPRLCNNVAVQSPRMNIETVWPNGATGLGLTGKGQVVAVADSGLDTGNMNTIHEDVRGRFLFSVVAGGERRKETTK